MKNFLIALVILVVSTLAASAQCTGLFPNNYVCGNVSGSAKIPGPVASSAVLGTQSNNTIMSNISGGVAIPSGNTLTSVMDAIACSTNGKFFGRSGGTWVCVDGVSSVSITAGTGITQSGSPITSSGAITVNVDKASAANTAAGTSNKVVTADIVVSAPALSALTPGATVTPDLNTAYNFSLTPSANFELMDPLNISGKEGRSFCIVVKNDSTPRTIAFDTEYFAPGGSSTITLTASAGALDQICGLIYTAAEVFLTITKNYSH